MITEPIDDGFYCEVFIEISLPLAWAKLIKEAGTHHYDWKCKATSAHGTVNALFNVATWNDDPDHGPEYEPSTVRVSWSDCDIMCKIMEQAHYHTPDVAMITRICGYLRTTMTRLANKTVDVNPR